MSAVLSGSSMAPDSKLGCHQINKFTVKLTVYLLIRMSARQQIVIRAVKPVQAKLTRRVCVFTNGMRSVKEIGVSMRVTGIPALAKGKTQLVFSLAQVFDGIRLILKPLVIMK